MSSQQQSTLNLPGELLNIVVAHLPPESIISLALTCRALHAQFFPSSSPPALSKPARATLVQWLEKDNPLLYWLCYDCHEPGQLHTRPCGYASYLPFPLCPVKYRGYAELVCERIYGDRGAPGRSERFLALCEVPAFLRASPPRRREFPRLVLSEEGKDLVRRVCQQTLECDDETQQQPASFLALGVPFARLCELGVLTGQRRQLPDL